MPQKTKPSDNTHDEEEKEPLFSPGSDSSGVYDKNDEIFNRTVRDNWSPDEQSDLSEAAREGDPDFENSDGLNNKELNNRESAGGTSGKGKVSGDESGLGDFGKDLELAADLAGGRLAGLMKFLGRNKKKAATGGVAGGIISFIILAFSIVQGPLQIIHMGEVLARSFTGQDDASNNRMGKLLRYARSGDPVDARLTFIQSQINKRAVAKLKERGVRFIRDPDTGFLKGFSLDHEKAPAYSNLSEEQAKIQIAKDNGISPDKVFKVSGAGGTDGKGAVFSFSSAVESDKNPRSMIRSAYDAADMGKLARAVSFRPVAEGLGKPGILHPWKRLSNYLEQKGVEKARELARERQAKQTERSPETKAKLEKLKSKVSESEGARTSANVALGLSLGICVVKDIASLLPDGSRGGVVLPAASLATDALAQSSQEKIGDDFSAWQPGAEVQNYKDKDGLTPWSGKALQALEGKKNPGGKDLDDGYKQAFSPNNGASDIERGLDKIGADYLCSPVGNALTAAAGIVLIATGPGTFAAKTVGGIGSTLVTAGILYSVTELVKSLVSESPPVSTLTGPLGGNFAAWGSRELANMDYRSAGGIEMSPGESALLDANHEQIEQQELDSKSFATRIFDPSYSKSLMANIIDYQSLSLTQNLSNFASSLVHPSSLFSTFSSALFPKATAAGSNYDWGDFHQFGFTSSELNDSAYEDPWGNAEKVAHLLEGSRGDDYIDRASQCFGVSIEKGEYGWDAVKKKDVNPGSTDYKEADCNDSSKSWTRLRFFLFDTSLAKGNECYEGDEDICTELGFNKDSASPDPGGGGGGGAISGDAQSLAQQLLNLSTDGKIIFNDLWSDTDDGSAPVQNIRDTADGKEAKTTSTCASEGRGTQAPNATTPLSPKLLAFLVELAKVAPGVQINAIAGQCHSSSNSEHWKGHAVDIECNGAPSKSVLDKAARKTGVKNNGEVCPGNYHYHYSTTGA